MATRVGKKWEPPTWAFWSTGISSIITEQWRWHRETDLLCGIDSHTRVNQRDGTVEGRDNLHERHRTDPAGKLPVMSSRGHVCPDVSGDLRGNAAVGPVDKAKGHCAGNAAVVH